MANPRAEGNGGQREAARWLEVAVDTEKCRSCGCLHTVLIMLEDEPAGELARAMQRVRESQTKPEVNCRGCRPCIPMEALKAMRGME